MRSDAAMRFFHELRNISQKQGPISYVCRSTMNGGYTYRFVEDEIPLPHEVTEIDIRVSCANHLVKLGTLLLDFVTDMPLGDCPWWAFSEEGMKTLNFEWSDVDATVGLAPGGTNVDLTVEENFKDLRKEIEPLDICAIKRIASNDLRKDRGPLDFSHMGGDGLIDRFASHIANTTLRKNPRQRL